MTSACVDAMASPSSTVARACASAPTISPLASFSCENRSDFGDEAWILSRRNLWQRPCQQINCVIAPPLVGPFARLYCMQQNCRHRLLGFETDVDALLIMTVALVTILRSYSALSRALDAKHFNRALAPA